MVGKNLFLASLALEASVVSAFPWVVDRVGEAQAPQVTEDLDERQSTPTVPFPEWPGRPKHATYNKFDAKKQRVSTSGEHRYIAPKRSDIRGPCAGLNAAANHGYLRRDGIATKPDIMKGLAEAFGLSFDILTFLQTATAFFDGDPITGQWSIGGYSPKPALGGALQEELLGKITGICDFGHLKTEGDASITRGDFLAPTMNDNCESYPKFTQELFDLADKMEPEGNITPRVMAQHQANRKRHSVRTNPNYFSPAYAGVAFTFGAHMFAYELLANRSAEHPRGYLSKQVFMDFFGYRRSKDGKLVRLSGQERIPENWYRRADDNKWDAADVVISTAQQCLSYPHNCQVGGNTGEVNSFAGVNLGDISGGLVNSAEDLSDPKRMGCFISQAIQADVPSFLDKLASGAALKKLIPKQLKPAMRLIELGGCENLPEGKSVTQYGNIFPGGKAMVDSLGKDHGLGGVLQRRE